MICRYEMNIETDHGRAYIQTESELMARDIIEKYGDSVVGIYEGGSGKKLNKETLKPEGGSW